ncbi:esterase-like activity of phytase family protein [Polaribacter sp.]|uniref:esterase-like activity of phytase family protein n=1 Tax=Polaribacter sp. TaxID=1920175 RepID=UPI0040475176
MKKSFFLLLLLLIFSCATKRNFNLSYIDEYIIPDSLQFQNQTIGGLSGIDVVNKVFYFVIDDSKNPRIVTAKIEIKNDRFQTVYFKKVIFLNSATNTFFKENELDLESIFVDEKTNEIHLVSEGEINKKKSPTIFKIDANGNFLEQFSLPKSLSKIENFKHNGVFESSCKSIDNQGFWVGVEAPLIVDGEEPNGSETSSPIRITYVDFQTKQATKQFAYQLERIPKPYKGNVNVTGVTALLEIEKNHFLVVERAYQNNYGSYGNTIRIFEAFVDKNTTDILNIESLKKTPFTPLKKRLLFDFETIKKFLTDGIIDNIEGISLGPKLKNGNQSLILVADDNFQLYGKQLNQLILLEIKTNK